MTFLKGTQICYIAASVEVGNVGGLWPAFLRGERDKVSLGHQAVCLHMSLPPPSRRYVFQWLNDYSVTWCKHANNTLNLIFVAKIYEI